MKKRARTFTDCHRSLRLEGSIAEKALNEGQRSKADCLGLCVARRQEMKGHRRGTSELERKSDIAHLVRSKNESPGAGEDGSVGKGVCYQV